MRLIATFSGLLLMLATSAQTNFATIKSGNWSDPTVWINSVVPTGSNSADSIAVNHSLQVDADYFSMNAAFSLSEGNTLTILPGKRFYRSSSRSFMIGGAFIIDGNFRNSGASSYEQGIRILSSGSFVINGTLETGSYILAEGSFTINETGRVSGGGNFTFKGGFTNFNYISITNPIYFESDAINYDTLRVSNMYVTNASFTNTSRGNINVSSGLFITDNSSFLNLDSSYVNSFGKISISGSSSFVHEDSSYLRYTSELSLNDSSSFISNSQAKILCQASVFISPNSLFQNAGLVDNIGGTWTIKGNFANITAGLVFSNGTLKVNSGGRLSNAGIFTTGSGKITVDEGGTFQNFSIGNMNSGIEYQVSGLGINDGIIQSGNLTLTPSGIINNNGTFNISTLCSIAGLLNNSGNFNSRNLNIASSGKIQNNDLAVFDFSSSSITIDGTFERAGAGTDVILNLLDVKGTGLFIGSFLPRKLDPASASTVGTFTVTGLYSITESNAGPSININGVNPGTEHDQIIVNDPLELSGTLFTSFNFIPSSDVTLTIIKSSGINGTFQNFSPALPANWTVAYNNPQTGDVSLIYTNPLPLTLLDFAGNVLNKSVSLFWKTTDEINVDFYELERASTDMIFKPVYRVSAKNTTDLQTYMFTDLSPFSQSFYRLRMVDKDGSYSLSKTLQFSLSGVGPVIIYPNPVHTQLQVILPDLTTSNVQIMDATGRVYLQSVYNTEKILLQLRNLPAGTYILVIKQNGIMYQKQFIKK